MRDMELEAPFDILGLYHGVSIAYEDQGAATITIWFSFIAGLFSTIGRNMMKHWMPNHHACSGA